VNWRAYMRLDKMFLKMFQIEPRVPVRLLLDTSVSMSAGSPGAENKFEYSLRLAASFCYVGLVRLDTIEVLPFSGDLHEGKVCGGGRHRFSPLSQFLQTVKPEGTTNFLKVARQFLNEYPQRGLVIVISDFLDESGCDKALQYISDYGNELMLIQLWSPEDREPRYSGEFDFVDAETSARLRIHVDADSRRMYTEAFDRFSASIKTIAMRANGRYAGLPTSVPVDEAIFGQLMKSQVIA
jgi:uncharacterized protein (DUF58 family)